jgi:MinD superfamily P-loop ATPase
MPHGVVVNRADLGTEELSEFCRRQSLPILMEIPDDRMIAEAYSRGEMIVDIYPEYRERFLKLNDRIRQEVETHTSIQNRK